MKKNIDIKDTGHLVDQIVNDMRRKQLGIGDRYLTAKEVGDLFEVSTVTAHRALVQLAEKNIVIRKRKSGTFIGPGFVMSPDEGPDAIHAMHVLMDSSYSVSFPSVFEFFRSILEELYPQAALQFHIVPENNALLFSKRVADQIRSSEYREGVVLIRSSESEQVVFNDCDFPVVIFGSAFSGIALSNFDNDQEKVGRLVSDYLLEKSCTRFLLFQRSNWCCGDNLLYNSICAVLGGANLPMGSLMIQSIPLGRDVLESELKQMLLQISPSEKLGLIARDNDFAKRIQAAIDNGDNEELKQRVFLASCSYDTESKKMPFFQVVPQIKYRDQVRMLIEQLVLESSDIKIEKKKVNFDVKAKL